MLNVCPVTVRLLFNIYEQSTLQVIWSNIKSDKFSVSTRVKQGARVSLLIYFVSIHDEAGYNDRNMCD